MTLTCVCVLARRRKEQQGAVSSAHHAPYTHPPSGLFRPPRPHDQRSSQGFQAARSTSTNRPHPHPSKLIPLLGWLVALAMLIGLSVSARMTRGIYEREMARVTRVKSELQGELLPDGSTGTSKKHPNQRQ